MAELKPCPFCGGKPQFGKPNETKTSLRCSNPQCYLWWNPPTSWHNCDTEEHARQRLITWWNRRTPEIVAVETNIFDKEEIYPDCTVQVLTNTATGEVSVGWWKNGNAT